MCPSLRAYTYSVNQKQQYDHQSVLRPKGNTILGLHSSFINASNMNCITTIGALVIIHIRPPKFITHLSPADFSLLSFSQRLNTFFSLMTVSPPNTPYIFMTPWIFASSFLLYYHTSSQVSVMFLQVSPLQHLCPLLATKIISVRKYP